MFCIRCDSIRLMKTSLWLHNIRSAYNVGSLFRTADAVGIQHIYLSGYTPLPIDRFGRYRSDIAKTALGSEKTLSWSQLKNIPKDILELKSRGNFFVCVEQDKKSIDIFEARLPQGKDIILAVGEETRGFEPELLGLADMIVEIPMRGKKESLNVTVAFGIAAYTLLK